MIDRDEMICTARWGSKCPLPLSLVRLYPEHRENAPTPLSRLVSHTGAMDPYIPSTFMNSLTHMNGALACQSRENRALGLPPMK